MKAGIVSILGCGWLGMPLGRHLRSLRISVKGSVTSPEKFNMLRTLGISPYQVVLTESEVMVDDSNFFETDVLIISIPPQRIEGIERIFPAQIAQLIPLILKSEIRKVIFISSTSVYPVDMHTARENDVLSPDKASGKALVQAENLLRNLTDFQTTIIRFGGLIGADRNPARFLHKSDATIANTPVNLIHQEDCIGIISAIIEKNLWGEILNACCPEHPLKKDFYSKAAEISGLPIPSISDLEGAYKIIDSSKLKRLLKYQFKYLSPMDYLNSLGASLKQNME
jgi:nucleoside-diphosphate-sugar epimerase